MSQSTGKYYRVSRFRRLVIDLMHFSASVPSVTIERRMNLAALGAARQACTPPPTWSAIFTKAYAAVAARTAALRTSYLKFPWPRFYEHSVNIATINIDRQLAQERIVLYAHIASPQSCTLQELDAVIREHYTQTVDSIPSYRNAVRMSRVPWPLRRWLWWAALNIFGSIRCRHFGTFGTTSLGSLGAGVLHVLPLLTSTLHYGLFDAAGGIDMRLTFDHRVLDGGTAAQALAELEEVLLGTILQECRGASTSLPSHSVR
jgi:hypothetical protein